MPTSPNIAGALLRGPRARAAPFPVTLSACFGELRSRFIPKGRVGRGHRAIARNGRVLLASDRPVEDLAGRTGQVRVQIWNKRILPQDTPEPYGLLICVRTDRPTEATSALVARLTADGTSRGELILEVGGGTVLEFVAGDAD
jgi:hypothetical protein